MLFIRFSFHRVVEHDSDGRPTWSPASALDNIGTHIIACAVRTCACSLPLILTLLTDQTILHVPKGTFEGKRLSKTRTDSTLKASRGQPGAPRRWLPTSKASLYGRNDQTSSNLILVANSRELMSPHLSHLLPYSVSTANALRWHQWRSLTMSLHPREIATVPEETRRVA